jgi:small subunit ribosomal protein S2
MKPYIFGRRNGIYIIDLQQTVTQFQKALDFVVDLASRGGTVLFVGTKRQAQEAIMEEAGRAGMPYVNNRWLGGTLTNFATIRKRIERLRWLESLENDPSRKEGMTKKELIGLDKEKEKLVKVLAGLRGVSGLPSALFVVDPSKERIAVTEARKLDIAVIAVVDTNCDPEEVDFPIPGNDDAIRAIRLFASRIADAIAEGAGFHSRAVEGGEPAAPAGGDLEAPPAHEGAGRDEGGPAPPTRPRARARSRAAAAAPEPGPGPDGAPRGAEPSTAAAEGTIVAEVP